MFSFAESFVEVDCDELKKRALWALIRCAIVGTLEAFVLSASAKFCGDLRTVPLLKSARFLRSVELFAVSSSPQSSGIVEERTSVRGLVNLHCDFGDINFDMHFCFSLKCLGEEGEMEVNRRFWSVFGEALSSRIFRSVWSGLGECFDNFSCSTADSFLVLTDAIFVFVPCCNSSFLKSSRDVCGVPLRLLQVPFCLSGDNLSIFVLYSTNSPSLGDQLNRERVFSPKYPVSGDFTLVSGLLHRFGVNVGESIRLSTVVIFIFFLPLCITAYSSSVLIVDFFGDSNFCSKFTAAFKSLRLFDDGVDD